MNAASLFLVVISLAFFSLAFVQTKGRLAKRLSPRTTLAILEPKRSVYRNADLLLEIPDFGSLIGFAVYAGEPLENALRLAVSRSSSFLANEFLAVIHNVDHGSVLGVELEELATESSSEQVRELASKLALASTNGSAVSDLIADYVESSIQELKAHLLERAGKNETKMMVPLVFVILPITVMFAVYPSLTLIQSSFL